MSRGSRSTERSKSPETLTGQHLTVIGPTDWAANQLCYSSSQHLHICMFVQLHFL